MNNLPKIKAKIDQLLPVSIDEAKTELKIASKLLSKVTNSDELVGEVEEGADVSVLISDIYKSLTVYDNYVDLSHSVKSTIATAKECVLRASCLVEPLPVKEEVVAESTEDHVDAPQA